MTITPQIKEKAPKATPANTDKPIYAAAQHWSQHSQAQMRKLARSLAAFVLIPTFLAVVYYGLIAAPQYQTEMHISVRSPQGSTSSLIGSFMSGVTTMSQSMQDVKNVADYIHSHDAVRALDQKIDLKKIYRHPDADFLTRYPADAPFETLVGRYRESVDVKFDIETGMAVVKVRAYAPEDAQLIADEILKLSENAVNGFNMRAQEDSLRLAREELAKAEDRLTQVRLKLIDFRVKNGEIDPTAKSTSIHGIITKLEQDYSAAQAEQRELAGYMTPNNEALKAVNRRVASLRTQIQKEEARLVGKGDTYTQKLSEYEPLLIEQEMAIKAYESALASLEGARIEAQRQQSYVIPVVKPNLPQAAEYPRRLRSIALVFICSLLIFGIGRLIYAGVRDHMMH